MISNSSYQLEEFDGDGHAPVVLPGWRLIRAVLYIIVHALRPWLRLAFFHHLGGLLLRYRMRSTVNIS